MKTISNYTSDPSHHKSSMTLPLGYQMNKNLNTDSNSLPNCLGPSISNKENGKHMSSLLICLYMSNLFSKPNFWQQL
jgi:hypothetical protein